jgi:hypothetical protein
MSSDPRSIEDALHKNATHPWNFNPENGQWESRDGKSQVPRTTHVFDPKMNSDPRYVENAFHETAVLPRNRQLAC